MAFLTEKSLFIHIQKTGGMSVRRVLYQCRPLGRESGESEAERHFGLPELRASHPGIDAGRLSFGFVRHPVDWIRSRWAFGVMSGLGVQMAHNRAAAVTWMAACWSDDFEQFVENYLARYPGVATQTMFRMLALWSPKPAEFVGRTESLFTDLRTALNMAGENLPLEGMARRNVTAEELIDKAPISPAIRAAIMDAEKPLCEKYGYS